MKKLLVTLVVLALALPALAEDVTFTATDNADGSFTISYTSTTAPRGIALAVSTDGTEVTDCSDVLEFEALFNCFMDQAADTIAAGGEYLLTSPGCPLADPAAAGLPTFPASVFSICMGALDEDQDATLGEPGPASADLITIQLDDTNGSFPSVVTIDEDSFRGGVVGSVLTTNLPITVTVTKGAPFCVGDFNGDGVVNGSDVSGFVGAFGSVCASTDCRGDFNGDGVVNGSDVSGFVGAFGSVCP